MLQLLHLLLLPSASTAATPDATLRFKGIAYTAVNDNATHNIQVLAWIDSASFVGHWSVHHEGTGVNRTAIKSWVPPKPLGPVITKLVNSTSHMPAGLRGIKASMYGNESGAALDNILPSDANCSGKWPDVKTFSGVWWEHGAAEVAALHDQVLSAYKAAGGELDYWVPLPVNCFTSCVCVCARARVTYAFFGAGSGRRAGRLDALVVDCQGPG